MQVRNLLCSLAFGLITFSLNAQEIGDAIPDYQQFYNDAIEKLAQNEPESALMELGKIHPGDTLYLDAVAQKAIAHFRLGDVASAQKMLDEIGEKNHAHKLDLHEVRIGLKMSEPKEVQTAMDSFIDKYANISRAHVIEGDLLLQLDKPADALASYEKAVEINPYDAEAHYRLADFAYYHEKYTLAVSAAYAATCAKYIQEDISESDVDRLNSICDLSAEKNKRFDGTESALFAHVQKWSTSDVVLKNEDSEGEAPSISVQVDQPYVAPLTYVAQELADDQSDSKNEMLEMYKSFFANILEERQLNGMVILPVFGLEGEEAEKQQRLFASKALAFKNIIQTQITSSTKKKRVKIDGVWKKKDFNYDNGMLVSVGNYKDEIPDGEFIFYHLNGQVKMTAFFKTGRLDDMLDIYDTRGNRLEQQVWDSGKLIRTLSRWDANGNLVLEAEPDSYGRIKEVTTFGWNGEQSMTYKTNKYGALEFTYYNASGNKSMTTYKAAGATDEIVKSQYHGNGEIAYSYQLGGRSATFFDEDGNKVASGPMSKNLRHKEWTWVNDKGNVIEKGKYSKGSKHGVWYNYYNDGSLQEFTKYSKGMLNGVGQTLDFGGKTVMYVKYKKDVPVMLQVYAPDSSIIYEASTYGGQMEFKRYNNLRNCSMEGNIVGKEKDGEWKEYFYNGVLSDVNKFEDGMRVGVSTNYHYNGAPSSMYFYDQDTLKGRYEKYYRNGQLQQSGYYHEGRTNGVVKAYDIFGNLAEEVFLIDGTLNGPKTIYYANGNKRRVIYYEMDVIDRVVSFNTGGKITDEFIAEKGETDYRLTHPNGEVYLETKLKNSLMVGEAVWYSPNKTVLRKQTEIDGLTEGAYKTFYDNGQLRLEGEYKWGDRVGEWKKYALDGSLMRVDTYKDGVMHGVQKFYSKTGELYSERNFANGSLHGKTTYFSSTGEIGAELIYINSTLVAYSYLDASGDKKTVDFPKNETGEVVCYYQNGNESLRFSLKNGMRDGTWTLSFENGQEHYISNYAEGMAEGDFMEFGMDGTLWSSVQYRFGEYDGQLIENYVDGKPAASIEAFQGSFHGPGTFYDKEGAVTLTGNYVYDSFYVE